MATQSNTIRIIAGELRSRKISFPASEAVRPTGDRIRETLFNWLQHDIEGSTCLDLFAGSGALGIEALSRGANEAVFVDKEKSIVEALVANLQLLQLENGTVFHDKALAWIEKNDIQLQFDVLFLDPPFNEEILAKTCELLDQSNLLSPDCLIYIELAKSVAEFNLPTNWKLLREKQAGSVFFYLFSNKS